MYQSFEYSLSDGIALVRLNRPNKLNAIDNVMVREFGELAANIRGDKSARVVIFTGNGRAFCAGADIASLNSIENSGDFMTHIENIQKNFNALDDLDRPTIAAINGLAFGGGCELSLVCDFRVMAEEASLGVPEILIGVLPGGGGTQRLAKMLPPAIAKQMIYLGEPLTAAQALHFGLVEPLRGAGGAGTGRCDRARAPVARGAAAGRALREAAGAYRHERRSEDRHRGRAAGDGVSVRDRRSGRGDGCLSGESARRRSRGVRPNAGRGRRAMHARRRGRVAAGRRVAGGAIS